MGLQLFLIAFGQELCLVIFLFEGGIKVVDFCSQGGFDELTQSPHIWNTVLSFIDKLRSLTVQSLVACLFDGVHVVAEMGGELLESINLLIFLAFYMLEFWVESVLDGFFHGYSWLELIDFFTQFILDIPMMILEIAHLLIVPLFQLLPFLLTLIASLAPQLLLPLRYLFFCTFLWFKLCLHSTQYLALLVVVESHTVKLPSGTIKIVGCLLMIGNSVLIFLE